MKIEIIVVYQKRYRMGHEANFVPPLTGIHLAALTPDAHQVRVIHQQVEPIDFETNADLIALSFFSGFAEEAYAIADTFRQLGKRVIAGGPHATFCPEESLVHFDSIVIGEAEGVWSQVLQDAERGSLAPTYQGATPSLEKLPTPRYDLLSRHFFIRKVVQATRGCAYTCTFCSTPAMNPGFRLRPVESVLADVAYDRFPRWWQRKVVWFWDDNLTLNRRYVKELLTGMIPLRKWWLTQASMDITEDEELLDLMQKSGCIGIFLGIETFTRESLESAGKRQNHVESYRKAVKKLHRRGICVMAGLIAGFDHDTPETITAMARHMAEIGIDVPFISVLTPFKGTKLWQCFAEENRLLPDRGWRCFNGYNVAFLPRRMTPSQLKDAHTQLWRKAFSPAHTLRRMLRSLFTLRPGAALMSLCMNGLYGLKRLRGNLPLDMSSKLEERSVGEGYRESPVPMATPTWAS